MEPWKVDESAEVLLQIARSPEKIQKKYSIWRQLVRLSGPFLPGKGWSTEALRGNLKGFHSARLDQKWRVIFEVEGKVRVIGVLSVTPHLYDRMRR